MTNAVQQSLIRELEEIANAMVRTNKLRADQLRDLIPQIRAEFTRLLGDAYASEATAKAATGMLDYSGAEFELSVKAAADADFEEFCQDGQKCGAVTTGCRVGYCQRKALAEVGLEYKRTAEKRMDRLADVIKHHHSVPPEYQRTCPNCDSPMPEGCRGIFKSDGKSCLLNA